MVRSLDICFAILLERAFGQVTGRTSHTKMHGSPSGPGFNLIPMPGGFGAPGKTNLPWHSGGPNGKITTKEQYTLWYSTGDTSCHLCTNGTESSEHLFFRCTNVVEI